MSLTRNLLNGNEIVDVGDFIDTLDGEMWQVVIEAVEVRRGET